MPKKKREKLTKICVHCLSEFETYRPQAKYCSSKCRYAVYNKEHPRLDDPQTILRAYWRESKRRQKERKKGEAVI